MTAVPPVAVPASAPLGRPAPAAVRSRMPAVATLTVSVTVAALAWLTPLLFAPLRGQAQEFRFLDAAAAQPVLANRDAFSKRLSPFDRSARLKTNGVVTPEAFARFVAGETRDWTAPEKAGIEAALKEIRPAVQRLGLPLPAEIQWIKTTGREEGNAPYTRGTAIILPQATVNGASARLPRVLAHELFHVASRTDNALRDRLYALIGFEPCGEVNHPAGLKDRRITNPDAPVNQHAIQLEVAGQPVWGVPILFASQATYDPVRGGEFFQYLKAEFLLVERSPQGGHRVPDAGGEGRHLPFKEVQGFQEKIGRNTSYTIHPEEILADNFALLVTGATEVPTPELLTRIQQALRPPPR
jgi:hypothetical protein